MSGLLVILNQWIISPIKNYIFLPMLNNLTPYFGNDFILPTLNQGIKYSQDFIVFSFCVQIFKKWLLPCIKKYITKIFNKWIENYVDGIRMRFEKENKARIRRRIWDRFKCDSNIEELEKQNAMLKFHRDRLKLSVFAAKVTDWLSSANNEIDEAEALIQRKEEVKMKTCFFGLCPNLSSRYQLSRAADKKASDIEHLNNGALALPIVEPSVYSREALPSRVLILKQITDALKDPKLNMILVHGTAGVGKSILAKEVQRKALEENLFNYVVMVAVSQTPDLRRIQQEIADFLGLKFDAHEVSPRASQLKQKLEGSKALIILEDVWEKFVLNDVGIPLDGDESKGVKLLLTSRRSDVLTQDMGTEKQFKLEFLEKEEAWKLFARKASNANDPELRPIANEVADKCEGHPFLTEIVAARLKTEMELSAWSETLERLSLYTEDMFDEKLHNALQLSYEDLSDKIEKSFFLLFPFFGQSNIPISHLLTYAMGLGVVTTDRVQYARVKVNELIKKLKTKSLLLDGDMTGYVKMHNLVLTFARKIATDEQPAFFGRTGVELRRRPKEDCTRIALSYCDISKLPQDLKCPKAELFSLFTKDLNLVIPHVLFKEIKQLKVLNLTGMRLKRLPSSLYYLKKLRSLYLHQCQLDDVAIIRHLKLLEFLSFEGSYIVELPREIGELTQLKSINLTDCTELKVISPNILSKLSLLEELYMKKSFDGWDLNGNASVTDLDKLDYLKALEVRVPDAKKLPNGLFSRGLERHIILIGAWEWDGTYETSRTLKLMLETSIDLEDGLTALLRGTEDLYLGEVKGTKNGLYDLDEKGFQQLKHLHIRDNNVIRRIIDSSWNAFPKLETLSLSNLKSLEDICDDQLGTESFRKLRTLRITGCENLKKLFSFSAAKCLSQLQELKVGYCYNLEAIIAEGSDDGNYNNEEINFPHLSSIDLYALPCLGGICKQRKVQTEDCFSSERRGQLLETQTEDGLFSEMVSFPNLTRLEVSICNSLKYIFKTSMFKSLLQLKRLEIDCCLSMKEIIHTEKLEEEEEKENYESLKATKLTEKFKAEEMIDKIVFSELEFLKLSELDKLIRFSNGYPIEFPSLREMHIIKCLALKNFVSNISNTCERNSSSSDDIQLLFNEMVLFPNLTSLEVENCKSLKHIFKTSTVKNLSQLKRLKIEKCELMEEIILTDEFETEERTAKIVFLKLDFLELSGLDNLIRFSNGYPVEFQSLKEMNMRICPALKNFVSNISNSSSSNDIQSLFNEMVILPNLHTIDLSYMDNLEYIWQSQLAVDSFCKLKSLRILGCSNLEAVFATSNMIRRFQGLEELKLQGCSTMKEIYRLEEFNSRDKIAFELRNLTIGFMPSLKRIWSEVANGVFTFPNLKSVEVSVCDVLEYIFPASIAAGLSQLEELKIEKCRVEHIVGMPKSVDPVFKWRKLKYLKLLGCERANQLFLLLAKVSPNLQTLALSGIKSKDIQDSEFPNGSFSKLKVVELFNLDEDRSFLRRLLSLEKLFLKNSSLEELFTAIVRLQCLELIKVNNLKYIWKEDSPVPSKYLQTIKIDRCSHLMKIAASSVSFQNLTTLHISCCHKLENLVTLSTAKTMVHLMELGIENCEMVTEIVANDGDDIEHEIIFNQLKRLRLSYLPRLNRFCSSDNCTFHFPLLEQEIIVECSITTIFCGGDLVAPKLRKVQGRFAGQQLLEANLNGIIGPTLPKWNLQDFFSSMEIQQNGNSSASSVSFLKSPNVMD